MLDLNTTSGWDMLGFYTDGLVDLRVNLNPTFHGYPPQIQQFNTTGVYRYIESMQASHCYHLGSLLFLRAPEARSSWIRTSTKHFDQLG